MEPSHLQQMLASMPLLAHMEEEKRVQITSTMLECVAVSEGGTVIIREGDLGQNMYFVVEGKALAEIKGDVVMCYEPGDYFGELSLLTGAPRKATVKAGPEGARCLVLTRELFETLDFNEAMWEERQRMYDAANAERIQQFFATSSSEEDESEDGGDGVRVPSEGIPSEQRLTDTTGAELREQLSIAKLDSAQAEAQKEAEQTLIRSIEVVRSAQAELNDSSRRYSASLQAQVEAGSQEIAVLTAANTKLTETVRGIVDMLSEGVPPSQQMLTAEVSRLTATNAELLEQLNKAKLGVPKRPEEARQTLIRSMEVVRSAQAELNASSRRYSASLQAQVEAGAKEIAVLTAANTKLTETVRGFANRQQISPTSSTSREQQQAAIGDRENIINQLRARLANEHLDYDSTVASLRKEVAEREQQVCRLEAALRDARRQHAKGERFIRVDADAQTAAPYRLGHVSHQLLDGGYMPPRFRKTSSYGGHENSIDDVRSLDYVLDMHSEGQAGSVLRNDAEESSSSTGDLMELVDLVSKEF